MAAIRVNDLGKRYQLALGGQRTRYRTLRESLVEAVSSPFRRSGRNRNRADDFWALTDVSFEVQPGEVVGIVGRNGAGKSTLLKVLSRITKPTTGRVEINGRVGSLLEVGTGFHPELTGRENIYLNGSILGMSRKEIDRKFDEIVAFAEVEKFLDTPVKRYSSGMYVRLAFAVAAHLHPDVLIVDEVLAVGDAEFQRKCLGRMEAVARDGRSVLFVSHNLQAVSRLTTRCILLEKGRKVFDGPTLEGLTTYSQRGGARDGRYRADGDARWNRVRRAVVHASDGPGVHRWGQPITFEFDVEVINPADAMCFSFQVVNEMYVPVCHLWHFESAARWGRAPGVYRLRFVVPKFRAFMGTFTLTTWLSDRRTNIAYESLNDVCEFEVAMTGVHREQYDWRKGDCTYLEDFACEPVEAVTDVEGS